MKDEQLCPNCDHRVDAHPATLQYCLHVGCRCELTYMLLHRAAEILPHKETNPLSWWKILNDDRKVTLYPEILGARMLINKPEYRPDPALRYERSKTPTYCEVGGDELYTFDGFDVALEAFLVWDGYGEPENWRRHRLGGEPWRRRRECGCITVDKRGSEVAPYHDSTNCAGP